MKIHALLLFLHLTAAVVWIGGMFFAHFCLRPAALATLEPAQRLPLWRTVFARFFPWVNIAIVLLLISGGAMLVSSGHTSLPPGWHAMIGIGSLMVVIYLVVRLGPYRAFCQALERNDLPAAATAQNRIRLLVATNLTLGILVLASVTLGLAL
ncbi:MAG TPA: CopD family protein [Rhodocyclaceae bacterium]|jgi:uncharacterized membrane protein|nr:CopD family protein [Rhodocyclaceae bacterium]